MTSTTPVTAVDVVRQFAVITVTRPADAFGGTAVFGATVPVAGLAAVLFGAIPLAMPTAGIAPTGVTTPIFIHQGPAAALHAAHMAEHRRLVQLDTFGLGVAADSMAIFGSVANRPYMATMVLPPPLQRLRVNVAMMSSQVSLPLLMPFAHDRLMHNGALIVATIVVCIFAIGASRREVALARARSDFVAGVSHDLRMPLAQILLASETLSLGRERNAGERATLVASILREGRRLKAMIDNVLLFSRAGAVGVEPHLQVIDTRALLASVAESVDLALADMGQTIETRAADDAHALADRALMHQALVNLVDNAMKYGPRGQRIRLGAMPAGRRVEISVADEGPGIPAAARERLFEAYERLSQDSTSERTGSGLGLAVVRQIVEACRGTIRIDDAERGARIVISLPAAQ
jgi:signal transduction histidine kinase